jgi:hypothetical protein
MCERAEQAQQEAQQRQQAQQQEQMQRQQEMQRAQSQQPRSSGQSAGVQSPGNGYRSPAANGGATTTYTPHTYTPGSSQARQSEERSSGGVQSENGVTTFTPHASSSLRNNQVTTETRPTRSSDEGVTSNGVTTFTPHAAGSSHAGFAANGGGDSGRASDSQAQTFKPGRAAPEDTREVRPDLASNQGAEPSRQQINSVRTNLTGINQHPVPHGTVTAQANGTVTVKATDGRQYALRSDGTLASYAGHGTHATLYSDGRVRSLHTAALDINRGPHDSRIVVEHRADHTIVVSAGAHGGYVERPIQWHGRPFVQRTYVSGAHVFTRVYASYGYHGVTLHNYVPSVRYAPAFYGWAYYPWPGPVAYAWGWTGSPWYTADTGYFSVLPAYGSPALWLADYLLAGTLQAVYVQQQADAEAAADAAAAQSADADPGGDVAYAQADAPITPELRQAISNEVAQQLAAENAAAQKPEAAETLTGLPQALQPNHLFVVDHLINVTSDDGHSCGLTPGDVLKLVAAPGDNAITANLSVTATRKADCPADAQVSVTLEDLQEMHNGFRAQLDAGLQALHDQQGQNGLPSAPQSAIAPPPRPIEDVPPPMASAQTLINGAQQQADHAETQLSQAAFSN